MASIRETPKLLAPIRCARSKEREVGSDIEVCLLGFVCSIVIAGQIICGGLKTSDSGHKLKE